MNEEKTQQVLENNTPVSPAECKHRRSIFISEKRYMGVDYDHGRERVEVCPDCGTFLVWGDKNGVHFSVSFTLPTEELVRAAGQYVKRLEREEGLIPSPGDRASCKSCGEEIVYTGSCWNHCGQRQPRHIAEPR